MLILQLWLGKFSGTKRNTQLSSGISNLVAYRQREETLVSRWVTFKNNSRFLLEV